MAGSDRRSVARRPAPSPAGGQAVGTWQGPPSAQVARSSGRRLALAAASAAKLHTDRQGRTRPRRTLEAGRVRVGPGRRRGARAGERARSGEGRPVATQLRGRLQMVTARPASWSRRPGWRRG
jgi:hypothetical protein